MRRLLALPGRVHDKVMPLHHFPVEYLDPSEGGYPTELSGGREFLQRRARKYIEIVLGALCAFTASGFILDAVAPDASNWEGFLILGPSCAALLAVAGWAVKQLNRSETQLTSELSHAAARRTPLELRLEWESCYPLRPLIREALEAAVDELTEGEAEVVRALSTEHTGTIRELVEIAQALCRAENTHLPQGVQHESSRAHS